MQTTQPKISTWLTRSQKKNLVNGLFYSFLIVIFVSKWDSMYESLMTDTPYSAFSWHYLGELNASIGWIIVHASVGLVACYLAGEWWLADDGQEGNQSDSFRHRVINIDIIFILVTIWHVHHFVNLPMWMALAINVTLMTSLYLSVTFNWKQWHFWTLYSPLLFEILLFVLFKLINPLYLHISQYSLHVNKEEKFY